MKVLFVCTGNTCRSPMAEGFLNKIAKENNDDSISAFSRGLAAYGERVSKNSLEASKKIDVQIDSHMSRQLTVDDFINADVVLTMTKDQCNFLKSEAGKYKDKIYCISEYADSEEISDPYGQNLEVYEKCAQSLFNACRKIYEKHMKGQK